MSFLRKNTAFLGFSLLAALGVAVGCSRDEEGDVAGSVSGITQSEDLVISQVYGGGSNAGAAFSHDFIELFNRGKGDVELGGKVLQYTSSTANFSATNNIVKLPAFTLKAGNYYVVQLAGPAVTASADAGADSGAADDAGAAPAAAPAFPPLPKVDYVATGEAELIALSKEKGKVALTTEANALDACGKTDVPCDPAKIEALIDFVGYGGANQFETAPTPALGSDRAAIRNGAGCADEGDNSVDFDTAHPPALHLTPSPDCDTVDASAPPPPVKADAGKTQKDGGVKAVPQSGDDDDSEETAGDDDDGALPSGNVKTKPTKKAETKPGATPPQFGASQPDACAMSSGPRSTSAGLAGVFGLALALTALRRRSR